MQNPNILGCSYLAWLPSRKTPLSASTQILIFQNTGAYKWVHALKGNHATYPVDPQVTDVLDAELAKKGLKKTDSDTADLFICYHSNFGTEKFSKYGSEFEGTYMFTIQTGQVAIDMYDAPTKKLVWRNTADINSKARPKDIAKALSKLLKNYPPKKS